MTQILKPMRVLLLIGFVLGVIGCDSKQDIVSGLSEHDANEVLVVLQSQKIDAGKTVIPGRTVTYSISVKASAANDALRILVDNKLPREKSKGWSDVYPVGGGGLIPTASEEKAKFLMSIQGECENMLKVLPGIVQAKVVVVLPDTDAIRDINAPAPKSTASVAIVYNPIDDKGTPSITPDDVKYLLSSAVEDLSPTSVTVVMASNVPMKLIDIAKNPPQKSTAKPTPPPVSNAAPAGPTTTSPHDMTSPPSHSPKGSLSPDLHSQNSAAKAAEARNHLLLWLFGTLAVIGLLLGLFGLVRSVSMRSKLAKMERGITSMPAANAPPEMPPGAQEPPARGP